MADYVIGIHVQSDKTKQGFGSVSYTWSALHAAPGDKVSWISEQGPFAIVFRDRSPFEENKHGISSQPEKKPFASAPATVARGAQLYGAYYYAVAVTVDGQVFMDAGCPSVVIE